MSLGPISNNTISAKLGPTGPFRGGSPDKPGQPNEEGGNPPQSPDTFQMSPEIKGQIYSGQCGELPANTPAGLYMACERSRDIAAMGF